ncbi:hypothetical protein CPB85DRAFT_1232451 [Mucidula mucida]|nr:hypothetical protein CPB85DRAFT_1232451 [Mucidula mucida]
MSSLSGHTAHSERPERSRNAKAQARHRAKRKAYIEQLEQTVTKLQTQLNITPDQIAVLPPPLLKIRELEQENGRLLKENEELRRMLQETNGGRPLALDLSRRTISHDSRNGERDMKRRRPDGDDLYMDNASLPDLRPPPPLTIPHHSQYGQVSHSSHSGPGSAIYSMNGTPFQLPNTPSGSSSTSSPPFSATQMHSHAHSPSNGRASLPTSHNGNGSHYNSVKVEDDSYPHSNGHYSNSMPGNSLPPFTYPSQSEHGLENWHAYSSERAPLHR